MIANLLPAPQTQNQADIAALAAEYFLGCAAGADSRQFNDEHRAALRHHGLKPGADKTLNLQLLDSKRYAAEVQNAMSSGDGRKGAFLAPTGMSPAIEFSMAAKSAIRQTASVLRVDGGTVFMASVDPHASGQAGFIVREADTNTRQTPAFRRFEFAKQTYAAEYAAPTSMVDDAPGWSELIGTALGAAIGDIQNQSFTETLVSMATGSPSAATAIAGDDIENLIAAIGPGHLSENCAFMVSPSAWLAVRKLKDSGSAYLYTRDSSGLRLAGFRLLVNEHLDATGVAGAVPILFGDLSRFHVIDDSAVKVVPLLEPLIEQNATLWFASLRSAGVLVNPGSNPIAKLVLS